MNKNIKNFTRIFKTLADENRIKILLSVHKKECKCEGNEPFNRNETCIKDLSKSLNITIPTISHHIKELVNAGLITTKKEGRWVYCRINQKAFQEVCSFLNNFSTRKGRGYQKNSIKGGSNMAKKIGAKTNSVTVQEQKGCGCDACGPAPRESTENTAGKLLKIRWQRLIFEGETCPRCGSTEKEVDRAVSTLKQSLAPLGIEVIVEKEELSVAEFKEDPLQSNRIWINNRPLEDWIEGRVGRSPCCDVCGPSECRTLEVEGKIYEAIPAELIIKAGLIAASELAGEDAN
ncbi:MAG: metalloregulator ArsR/SmtB family transcription factor [Firmicutes bacterium]|nr:metalloregulator ArsR/SmtB family transcription factor [Bacillota bacterium]